MTFKHISIIGRLKDGIPNLLILGFIVKWSQLSISWQVVPVGIMIFLLGTWIWHCFRFMFTLPVFFTGQSDQIFNLAGSFGYKDIPYEGYPKSLQNLFITLIPSIITVQVSASVMLGKSDPIYMLSLVSLVAIIFTCLKILGWNWALKNYTSASS